MRIEFAGAIYHVTVRGNAREAILEEKTALKEIPRAQRLAHGRALPTLLIAKVCACLEYGYTMSAGGQAAGVHYSTVSKVIKGER